MLKYNKQEKNTIAFDRTKNILYAHTNFDQRALNL